MELDDPVDPHAEEHDGDLDLGVSPGVLEPSVVGTPRVATGPPAPPQRQPQAFSKAASGLLNPKEGSNPSLGR